MLLVAARAAAANAKAERVEKLLRRRYGANPRPWYYVSGMWRWVLAFVAVAVGIAGGALAHTNKQLLSGGQWEAVLTHEPGSAGIVSSSYGSTAGGDSEREKAGWALMQDEEDAPA